MKYIIIAGGGLVNKGAQAMTLISVCELKKIYPDHKILLLAWNTGAGERKRHEMYDLELLQVPPLKFSGAAANPLKKVFYSLRYGNAFTKADEIYRNTDLLIDVSGYALGSNWSEKVCNDYLDNIEHALAYGVPVCLMPQSFGPFDFEGEAGARIDERIRKLLPKVKLICAREEEGYNALKNSYGLNNIVLTKDMVLASKIHDYTPALKGKLEYSLPDIAENSMCVIPNVRVADSGVNNIESLYLAAINAGLEQGLKVYITYHSTQDMELCAKLKAEFAENGDVILLEHDHSCIEFNELVKQFRFVAASRFHAIVHALKNGVPCVALGWAVKYIDLMDIFGQSAYMFDLRNETAPEDIQAAVSAMNENHAAESQKIKAALPALQEVNVFDLTKEAL
ncbi:MAG: polysaccharide pyruvyl transferase family protein [Oscillospiraceae bacterium]|nr:polysaccharide pyruvyl transferase family protein [Oscillospiraceae bacterium]